MPFESIEKFFDDEDSTKDSTLSDDIRPIEPKLKPNLEEVLSGEMNGVEEKIEKIETEKTGDAIRELIPISEELAGRINDSEWADYSTIMEKEENLVKKYGISNSAELSPHIIEAIQNDPDVENKLIESVKGNLEKLSLSPLDINIEAENITRNFLKTGNLQADTPESTTALYNAFLKDAKIFKTKEGEYKTLKDFSQENYFGQSVEVSDIECVTSEEHDVYSKQFGESLGLKGEKLIEFIESRKDVQAYMLEYGERINNQLIVQGKKIVFNQNADLNLAVIISAAIHEFGHDMIDKLSGGKRISLKASATDVISSKTINEGIAEDFTQCTLRLLDEVYRNKGFDLLAVNRQSSSLEAEYIPYKYGSSIVNAIRENSPEDFQTKKISELLRVYTGEIKIDKI